MEKGYEGVGKYLIAITLILLILLALAPVIALPNQTEVKLNNSLKIIADSNNEINESNETNNNITINVTAKEVSVIRVPSDYPTIQEAIDAAPPGSTIFIEDGEYPINDNEHTIRIENKNLLWIIGEGDVKLITSSGVFSEKIFNLIKIKNSEQITLSGFTVGVENSAKNQNRNIVIEDSNEITLSNLNLYNYATEGAEHVPLTISNASNCRIEGCKFSTEDGSAYGLIIGSKSKGNIIENNTFIDSTKSIFMGNTTDNILCNNKISRIYVGGEVPVSWPPVYCYSDNNTIYNNKISSISMQGSNNTIYNNIISLLGDKNNPTLPFAGNNNTIYLNNIFGIGKAGICGNNIWNSTTPVSYTYNGTTRTNHTGNFWFDYSGIDNNSDGIGDVPYKVCNNNYDYYPLIRPYRLTFDLSVTAIAMPYITCADRKNTILVTIGRTGTYVASEEVHVNLSVNDTEIESKTVEMSAGEKAVTFTWMPTDVGDYNLSVEVRPEDELISEMNDTNNEFSIAVVVSPQLFDCDYTAEISSALDFLNGTQLVTGAIWGFENSGWAALGIIAAGEDPSTGRWKPPGKDSRSLTEYLRKEPEDLAFFLGRGVNPPGLTMPSDFARMVMVISAMGEDPTNFGGVNYLTMLKSYYDGEQFGDPECPLDIEDDAFAILALISSGDKDSRTEDMIINASRYIKDRQNEDGGWGSFGGDSDVETTSIAIQALIAAGEDKNSETIMDALNYLKNAQNDDGGYADVKATSYAIQAFIAAGEDLSNYSKTIDYLLSLQQPDGSFNYTANFSLFPPRTTTFPIPALCGEPYPVTIKTIREDYELSDISVDNIVLEEDEICVNTSYTVTADVRSNGGIFDVDLYSDGELVEREEVKSVWHDSLNSVEYSLWKPNGTGIHNLTIVADSSNRVGESSEKNNNMSKQVTVVYPDLYPSEIILPPEIFVNATNIINVVIKGVTDESFNVTIDADGKFVGEKRMGGIRKEMKMAFEWRPSENRTYSLRLIVDSDDEVRERENDTSNVLILRVDVILPDMTLAELRADEGVYVNATNEITVTVEGTAECFNISLVDNGTVVGKTTNVTCYGKKDVSVIWKPKSIGNHTITAFVDSDDDIKETDEANNTLSAEFEVLLPDLVPVAIEPGIYYIDEFNDVNVGVNGTAEDFNVTLLVNYTGVDRSGTLGYLIRPIVKQTPYERIEIPATGLESNFTCNITDIKDEWSWDGIKQLDFEIGSVSETGMLDKNDSWSIDYVALIVNYTENKTLELAPGNVTLPGGWSNTSDILLPDGEYAKTSNITTLQLEMSDPQSTATEGNITSVTVLLKGHVSNMHTPPAYKHSFCLKKVNTDTYNRTIGFGWVPWYEGIYNLTVFLDSSNSINETNETNNMLSKEVLATKRIKLELTSPLGGETWKGIQNITWNASYDTSLPYNASLRIDIFYSPDRGYRWIPIATNETNDGVYAWNTGDGEAPADPIDGEYMIMIVARSGVVTAEDQSDIFYIRNKEPDEEWDSFHANAGYAPCDGPDTPETAWERNVSENIGACESSSLIVARGKAFVYATGEHGEMGSGGYTYLVALDKKTGEVEWAAEILPQQYGSWATPAYKDGGIFVASGGYLYRINANDGSIEWKFTLNCSVDSSPAVTSRAIYIGDWYGGYYYCIKNNRTEPKVLWTFELPLEEGGRCHAQSTPAIEYGNVYFGSFCDAVYRSRAYCVDVVNGTEIWSAPTGQVCGSLTVADGLVYFTTFGGDNFYALDAYNGSLIWKRHEGWSDSTPAYYSPPKSKSTRSYIYVVIVHGQPADVHCFDAKTGEEIWNTGGEGGQSGLGYWTASPVVTRDGKVFVGNSTTLSCLDAFTGEILWQAPGGPSPVVTNGFVYTVHGGRVIKYGNGTLPDLTVKKADAPDDRYIVGKKGNITATIRNIGKSNVTKSFKVELRYSGNFKEPIDNITVEASPESPFKVNDTKTKPISFEWTPEGWSSNESTKGYNLTVEVDPPPGNVTESNPLNNTAYITVNVKDNKPDLVTEIENVSPNPAYVGDTVTVEANITNIGNETNENFSAMFFVDNNQPNEPLSLPVNTSQRLNFNWIASKTGNHTLTVMAMINSDANYTNNTDSAVVEVKPTPTPTPSTTPTQTSPPGYGPGSGGGIGGGTAGGIGAGSGTGEAGAGEAGGMQIPVNASGSATETQKEVSGFPFGNATSGASGGGGTLPILLMLLAILVIALFYFGYYKEKRAYRRNKK